MKIYMFIALCCWSLSAQCQINQSLKLELDSIYRTDQKYRGYFSEISKDQKLADSLMAALRIKENLSNTLWTFQNRIDSSNIIRIETIMDAYGYPGSSLVGKPTNEVAWYVIQHSPKIERYLSMVQQAGRDNELPFSLVAMMQDRLMTQQLRPQIYGTQAACYPLKNPQSHRSQCFIWPIENPKKMLGNYIWR